MQVLAFLLTHADVYRTLEYVLAHLRKYLCALLHTCASTGTLAQVLAHLCIANLCTCAITHLCMYLHTHAESRTCTCTCVLAQVFAQARAQVLAQVIQAPAQVLA